MNALCMLAIAVLCFSTNCVTKQKFAIESIASTSTEYKLRKLGHSVVGVAQFLVMTDDNNNNDTNQEPKLKKVTS